METAQAYLSQLELVGSIMKFCGRHGFKDLTEKQMNSVIRAATLVADAMNKPYAPASEAMGLRAWLESDETGLSSRFMAYRIAGGPGARLYWPVDPGDFGRCVGLLKAVPEARLRLGEMADSGPAWASLVANWDELERLYAEEAPSGMAPKLYARMKELLGEAA